MSEETKAKIKRILVNSLIFGGAAFATAVLQYLQGVDFGQSTPFIVAGIGIAIKAIQAWIAPVPPPPF